MAVNLVSSHDAKMKALPQASRKAEKEADASSKRAKKAGKDGAASVELSDKAKKMAKAMQAGETPKDSRESVGAAAREQRMNNLVKFYANKLVKASEKIEKEREKAEAAGVEKTNESSGQKTKEMAAKKQPSMTSRKI